MRWAAGGDLSNEGVDSSNKQCSLVHFEMSSYFTLLLVFIVTARYHCEAFTGNRSPPPNPRPPPSPPLPPSPPFYGTFKCLTEDAYWGGSNAYFWKFQNDSCRNAGLSKEVSCSNDCIYDGKGSANRGKGNGPNAIAQGSDHWVGRWVGWRE